MAIFESLFSQISLFFVTLKILHSFPENIEITKSAFVFPVAATVTTLVDNDATVYPEQLTNKNSKKISNCLIPAYLTLQNQLQINDKIKKLIVCTGPGSFTALRVGIAFMYGLSISKKMI